MFHGITIVLGIVFLWLVYIYVHVNRRVRKAAADPVETMNREQVVRTFEESRKLFITRLRNPLGKVTQSEAEIALERAVACADRLDELDGRVHGTANRFKIRRELMLKFRNEADHWLGAEAAAYPIFVEHQRGGTIPERIGALLR